ncbi:MAG: DUF2628 domain-containing protein [Methanomassiliicoccales archaeon]|nr:DUF2628 domain-containing protein [Methanomassiliicoccales archaeon]MDD1755972.1 DUF2628 domain-containing protein [Methanomassiliicoccales archaeon]
MRGLEAVDLESTDKAPSQGNERIILGRRPLALRFGLTLLALFMGVVVLASAGQWVWSAVMLVILVLVAIVLYFWARNK